MTPESKKVFADLVAARKPVEDGIDVIEAQVFNQMRIGQPKTNHPSSLLTSLLTPLDLSPDLSLCADKLTGFIPLPLLPYAPTQLTLLFPRFFPCFTSWLVEDPTHGRACLKQIMATYRHDPQVILAFQGVMEMCVSKLLFVVLIALLIGGQEVVWQVSRREK